MKSIKMIHVGDVHYPDTYNQNLVDVKDKGLRDGFVKRISPNPFQKVSAELSKVLNSEKIEAILFSGDLTSQGDEAGYSSCVKHFFDLLEIDEKVKRGLVLHVVPGNHDIDREIAFSESSAKKFDIFIDAWERCGLQVLFPNEVRISSIENNKCKIRLFSLNTCLGCGELRRYPEEIRGSLKENIKSADLSDKDTFEVYCEKLDTPAADQDHLALIERTIMEDSDNHCMPVILAHHNLLPQPMVRTEIYTEVINAGHIRSVFNSIEYPVLYCHGHIHQDSIEVINRPKYGNSGLISVSAPKFSDGFNILEVFFTSTGVPVGCSVVTYNFKKFGSVRKEDEVRVRFNLIENIDEHCHEKVQEVHNLIVSEETRFNDLHSHLKSSSVDISPEDLSIVLRELEWIGVICIDNYKRRSNKWIIRRIGI